MKKIRHFLTGFLLAVLVGCSLNVTVLAQEMQSSPCGIEQFMEDTIIYRYRMRNGKLQRRRWNETKQCWVDPEWSDVKS